jgi:hypothetical protein
MRLRALPLLALLVAASPPLHAAVGDDGAVLWQFDTGG